MKLYYTLDGNPLSGEVFNDLTVDITDNEVDFRYYELGQSRTFAAELKKYGSNMRYTFCIDDDNEYRVLYTYEEHDDDIKHIRAGVSKIVKGKNMFEITRTLNGDNILSVNSFDHVFACKERVLNFVVKSC